MSVQVEPRIDSIDEVLARHARERGAQPAIVSAHGGCTYAELDRRVRAFALALRELGIRDGATVGLLCTNRPEWIVAALATVLAGGRAAAFNTWSKRWDLDHLLRSSHCAALVALTSFGQTDMVPLIRELVPEAWHAASPSWTSHEYPSLHELIVIGDGICPSGARRFGDLVEGDPEVPPPESRSRDATALVLYTSGSTARPKAVPLQQAVALEHGYDVGVRMGVSDTDRIWLAVPLFWSYGGANALMVSLTHGCTLVLQETFDAGEALRLIEAHACTVAYTLPNITAALLAHPRFCPDRTATLRKGMTIGSRADVAAAATDLGIAGICNAYGSTEIYGCCTATPHDWPLDRKLASQGPPLPRIDVTITDAESGAALDSGQIGEITVSGQVTAGYLDQEDVTTRVFAPDGGYHSGDLGRLDAYGNVVFVARATEMIKTGGINVAPAEVEEFLLTHPAVTAAAVTAAPDDRKGQVVIAFVVLSDPAADEASLRTFCRDHIASFKVPARIVVDADPLPTTSTGKLARSVLRERAEQVWPALAG